MVRGEVGSGLAVFMVFARLKVEVDVAKRSDDSDALFTVGLEGVSRVEVGGEVVFDMGDAGLMRGLGSIAGVNGEGFGCSDFGSSLIKPGSASKNRSLDGGMAGFDFCGWFSRFMFCQLRLLSATACLSKFISSGGISRGMTNSPVAIVESMIGE